MSPTKVSIVIPAYNYAHFLEKTLRSVLGQDDPLLDLEILLVDDGSTDNTRSLVQTHFPQVHYFYQTNQGECVARNTGIAAATGDFLLFLDADDLLPPNLLRTQIAALNAHPEADISVCQSLEWLLQDAGSARMQLRPLFMNHLDLHLCAANIAPAHAFLLRKKVYQNCRFETGRYPAEDYRYWLHCAAAGHRMIATPQAMVIYVKHGKSQQAMFNKHPPDSADNLALVASLLEQSPNFPLCGKSYGHLALASAFLKNVRKSKGTSQKMLLEEALFHLESFARLRHDQGRRADLEQIFDYYAIVCAFQAKQLTQDAISVFSAVKGLLDDCFPALSQIPLEDLNKERFRLLAQICFAKEEIAPKAQQHLLWLESWT